MIPLGPGQTILFNDDGREAIEAFTQLAHYVLVIFTDDKDDGAVIVPLLHGEGVIVEVRKHMRKYFVARKDARKFLRLFTAHQQAIGTGLYEPAPPARLVSMRATRAYPLPKDLPL